MNIETDLIALNKKSVEMEQAGADEPRAEQVRRFFDTLLSDQLVFRRASGKIVGKSGDEGFLEGLKNNPFKSRVPEDIVVKVLDDRVLVTLIIAATRKDDDSLHRYRNIRLFSRVKDRWTLELWYNYEVTG
jgi:hypothetical protein